MPTPYAHRRHLLQANIAPDEAWLLSNPHDVTYFTGFETLVPEERESLLWLSHDDAVLFHAAFSPAPADPELKCVPRLDARSLSDHAADMVKVKKVLLDYRTLTVSEHQKLLEFFAHTGELDPAKIWKLRQKKDETEVASITRAAQIAAECMAEVRRGIRAGVTEREIAVALAVALRQRGASHEAFPTIVAFGPHSALPHHQPDETPLEPETAVLIDFGVMVDGYRSDMTRSWWFGTQPDATYQVIKKAVDEAYAHSFETLRRSLTTGTPCTAADLDAAAREHIKNAGYGPQFIHTTGHGVGLEIHEPPSLSWQNKTVIEPGMVITIEPGIYLPGRFGYRFEETVVVGARAASEVTK